MIENNNFSTEDACIAVQAHFKSANRAFSCAVYFTQLKSSENPTYFLLFTLTDNTLKKYYPFSYVSANAPAFALCKLPKTPAFKDPHIKAALKELFTHNKIPLPDRLLTGALGIDTHSLQFQAGALANLNKTNAGFKFSFVAHDQSIKCQMQLSPAKSPAIGEERMQGLHGESMTVAGSLLHELSGTLEIADETFTITQGVSSLLTFRFGPAPTIDADYGMHQAILQLADGPSIFLQDVIDKTTATSVEKKLIVSQGDTQQIITHFELTAILEKDKQWRSPETFNSYPLHWKLSVPALQLELMITAQTPQQEVVSLLQPTYLHWQGHCAVSGILNNKPLHGNAFIARYHFPTVNNISDFFSSVSDEVYQQIAALIPMHPTLAEWHKLISVKTDEHILEGIDFDQLSEALIRPIREITDRQGKAWRAYIILACCNVVGGDFRQYLPLLTVELIHVGSLIVDDVEDKSLLRRGGPACHLLYGESIAINAGEMAYLLPQILFADLFRNLSKDKRCDIYEHYFDGIHAAHAGQALDIAGAEHLIKKILIDEVNPSALKAATLAIHRLKSGAPFGLISARIGAILGNATPEQVNQLGNYIESLGTAFQIIDDVLNLRGFKGETKTLGEDLMAGKITFPVAIAADLMPLADFKQLIIRIIAKPQDQEEVKQLITLLENTGAIQMSANLATTMVEESWQNLDPLIPDSFTKIMLRIFGRYIIERHY